MWNTITELSQLTEVLRTSVSALSPATLYGSNWNCTVTTHWGSENICEGIAIIVCQDSLYSKVRMGCSHVCLDGPMSDRPWLTSAVGEFHPHTSSHTPTTSDSHKLTYLHNVGTLQGRSKLFPGGVAKVYTYHNVMHISRGICRSGGMLLQENFVKLDTRRSFLRPFLGPKSHACSAIPSKQNFNRIYTHSLWGSDRRLRVT